MHVTRLFCPPLNRVGEGGRGDEGQRRTGMQNVAHLSQKLYPCEVWAGGMLTGVGFWTSACVPSLVAGVSTPSLPLLPVWAGSQG
jgi:hypothetical protein